MNYELAFLHSLLKTNDCQYINDINTELFLTYKSEFNFVLEHYKKYNKFPDASLVCEKYNLEFPELTEPIEYYKQELLKKHTFYQLSNTNEEFIKYLKDYDIDKAIDVLVKATNNLTKTKTKSKDIDIAKNIDIRLELYNSLRDGKEIKGIPTGWRTFDQKTGGWLDTDFVVLFAPAKSYKTYILLIWAINAWKNGHNVLFYSREMASKQITRRIDAILTGYTANDLRLGKLDDQKFSDFSLKLQEVFMNPYKPFFNIIDISGMDCAADIDFVKLKTIEYNPDIIFLDGLYLFSGDGKNDWERVKNITRKTKQLTLDINKPIIATTQAVKTTGEFLKSNDVAFSNSFKQDCDYLFGISRLYDEIKEELSNRIMVEALVARDIDGFKKFYDITTNLDFKEQDNANMTELIRGYKLDVNIPF